MNIAELKLDFNQGKKNSGTSCIVTLRDFTIEDRMVSTNDKFNTTR